MGQQMNVAAALNAAGPPVVANIEIVMTADGTVQARCNVPNRQVLLMMLETTKYDLERKLYERAKAPAEPQIETPNQGLLIAAAG